LTIFGYLKYAEGSERPQAVPGDGDEPAAFLNTSLWAVNALGKF
jgi:hypothetical protein